MKRLILTFIFIIISILSLSLSACSPTKEDLAGSVDLLYIVKDNYASVSIGECTDTDIIIPRYYLNYKVNRIEDYGFQDCSTMRSIYIPSTIKEIGIGAFYGCIGLEKIEIDEENKTYYSENNCIIKKATLSLIVGCKNSTIPSDIDVISANAFYGNALLTSIHIPSNIIKIDTKAFYNCPALEEVTVDDNNSIYQAVSNCIIETKTKTLIFGTNTNTIPNDCASIGAYAFASCSFIESLFVPKTVEVILDYAFSSCENLKDITFSEGLNYIGAHAFEKCVNLENFELPSSLVTISNSAFAYCDSITKVEMKEGLVTIGDNCFLYCEGLKEVIIPSTVTRIGKIVFSSCASLDSISISLDNKKYQSEEGCILSNYILFYMYKEASIPSSVSVIGEYAFSGSMVEEVSIPSNVLIISNNAFNYAYNLKKVVMEDGIKTIGDNAFASCNKLTSINIPSSVYTIGSNAFNNCESLKEVSLSSKVSVLNEGIFKNCQSLEDVYNTSQILIIYANAFYNCKLLNNIGLDSVKTIYDSAFYNCQTINCFNLKSIEYIGKKVFEACDNVIDVVLSNKLETIEAYAFKNMASLESLIIPISVKKIGDNCFYECYKLILYCEASGRKTNWSKTFNEDVLDTIWNYSIGIEE